MQVRGWGLISWEMQEFVSWQAGLLRAQLPVAMGSLWHLMVEGCVVSLEDYLDAGSSQQCPTLPSMLWVSFQCTSCSSKSWEFSELCGN